MSLSTIFLSSFFFQLLLLILIAVAILQQGFYSKTCPKAEFIVRDVMRKAMLKEPISVASVVMRMQFHDCFVDGCDGAVLLDDTPTMLGEKQSLSNIERRSELGRKDSLTASQKHSDDIIPSPNGSNATSLIDLFAKLNLSVNHLVAFSGLHSIGKARCFSVFNRLYNFSGTGDADPTLTPMFKDKLEKLCPRSGDENVTVGLDSTAQLFDNQYFKDLVNGLGFLHSDEILFTSPQTRDYVLKYSDDKLKPYFFKDFVEGMIKIGDLQSGEQGEIRRNCRVVNNS